MTSAASFPLACASPAERSALREAEIILNREAWLLDHRQFEAWLELVSHDIRYFAPSRAEVPSTADEEFLKPGRMALFDENYGLLTLRVKKYGTGRSWSDDPPSRIRRFVSNVVLFQITEDSLVIGSNLLAHRDTGFGETSRFSAYRHDTWVNKDENWLLARREITFDHLIVSAMPFIF